MVKLNVLNMDNFLQAVNSCVEAVNLLHSDGSKVNINKQYEIQNQLLNQYRENNNCLCLSLDIPSPKDYMSIILYYIGDC